MTDDRDWDETLADIRELPATTYVFGEPGPQNVAVSIVFPDGTRTEGTAIIAMKP